MDSAKPQQLGVSPAGSRLRYSTAMVIAMLVPGLASRMLRGRRNAGPGPLLLLLATPCAFVVFGPLWGEVLFANGGEQTRNFGLVPFVMVWALLVVASVVLASRDWHAIDAGACAPTPVGRGTVLGLLTLGLYWLFEFSEWSRTHAAAKIDAPRGPTVQTERVDATSARARRTQTLALIAACMTGVAILLLVLSFVWEEVLRRGAFPIPELPFWIFCWAALSVQALTWGALMAELRAILDDAGVAASNARPWLLSGGAARIPVVLGIHVIFALGLLPLLIFQPMAARAANGYLRMAAERPAAQ